MENNKLHILVVDDDDRIRNLLKDYLSENHYIVSTAENAAQAKIKLQYLKFDILILDVMMPGQNGYELTKEIKNGIKVPIIPATIISAGKAVASMEIAKPWITFVPWPVVDDFATLLTGL